MSRPGILDPQVRDLIRARFDSLFLSSAAAQKAWETRGSGWLRHRLRRRSRSLRLRALAVRAAASAPTAPQGKASSSVARKVADAMRSSFQSVGGATVQDIESLPNGGSAFSVRHYGAWEMPHDFDGDDEDAQDYDWEVPTAATKQKLDAYVARMSTPDTKVTWENEGEKNWIRIESTPRMPDASTPKQWTHEHTVAKVKAGAALLDAKVDSSDLGAVASHGDAMHATGTELYGYATQDGLSPSEKKSREWPKEVGWSLLDKARSSRTFVATKAKAKVEAYVSSGKMSKRDGAKAVKALAAGGAASARIVNTLLPNFEKMHGSPGKPK